MNATTTGTSTVNGTGSNIGGVTITGGGAVTGGGSNRSSVVSKPASSFTIHHS